MDSSQQCETCIKEQEELMERTDGCCGQIICDHNTNMNEGEEEEENDYELGEIVDDFTTPVVKKARKEKRKIQESEKNYVRKQLFEDETSDEINESDEGIFPTVKEMMQTNAIAFSKLCIEEVYQIIHAEKKTLKYNGEEIKTAFLTVKRKNIPGTQVVRATKTIYQALYEEHMYEKFRKTHRYFVMSLGQKTSATQKKYCNFIIKRI